ncbi:hypothetical protein BGZ49_005215, partial [Haplosporangium sp. Z 27]
MHSEQQNKTGPLPYHSPPPEQFGSPSLSYPPRLHRRPPVKPRSPFDQLFEDSSSYSSYSKDPDYNYIIGSQCAGYYCADTDTCVDRPIECPCPSVLDMKCLRGD